jgi:pyruvate,orthophosphate dikinase
MTDIAKFGFKTDGDATMSDLLGGKGANLAEMANLGMPVPFGITIPTTVCNEYRAMKEVAETTGFLCDLIDDHVMPALLEIEEELGYMPLWSVRSGAKHSMPGMMDTLLNIGLTNHNFDEWADKLGLLATLDCRRRQVQMYGTTVASMESKEFSKEWGWLLTYKYNLPAPPANEAEMILSLKHMKKAKENFETLYMTFNNKGFPETLKQQLLGSIRAVFDSWDSPRAIEYREMHDIPNSMGTAVNIQMMVFGNKNEESCSGVCFTRDPATGEAELMGEFLVNAQGEDVVAGVVTPNPISELEAFGADTAAELLMYAEKLEEHYRDMMDLEFTVEDGKLWMLQCRIGKRSAKAAFKIAHDMAFEGLISQADAVSRVSAKQYMAMKKIRVKGETPPHQYKGIAAGGGFVVGHVVTTAEQAKLVGKDKPVILVTDETTPEDFGGMAASVGILTRTGGATSHAAVVGRSLEKHCVVGCTDLPDLSGFPQKITIDGSTGRVWLEELPLTKGKVDPVASKILEWALKDANNVLIRSHIDDSVFENRYITTEGSDSKQFKDFLIKANEDDSITECYIDLTISGEEKLSSDEMLWKLVGESGNVLDTTALKERLATLIYTKGLSQLKKIAVLVPSQHCVTQEIDQLRKNGWKVVSRVTNLQELLDSDGIVVIDEGFAKEIGGEHVAAKLFKMMADSGNPVREKPKAVSQSRLVFDVLK